MDMRYLETFIKVCELGSYTAAADAMNISQPGVSKQIGRLQAGLGVTLLRREDNGIKLTEAGREVYLNGKNILSIWNKLSDACHSVSNQLSGLLRIGASTIPAKHLLPGILMNVHSTYPHVELSVNVADSQQILDSLYRGSIDIAYVGTKPEHPEADYIPMTADKLVVISNRPDWSDRDLADCPFILRETGSGTRTAFEQAISAMGLLPDKVKCAAEVSDTGLIIQLVEVGMGLAVVSSLDAESLIEQGRIKVVQQLPAERKFYLVFMRDSSCRALIEAFVQLATAPV
ncbi:selenium metabolism-associated LysR family transcriptional regulator [Paenibacillus sp. GD4]|uniref:selenium metabolism-associated LysR family transcriptional regulator n=1 Tax=Paenibacillus sp. GD4 TaxID=3068890 RepID=UPI00279685B8|nr:selenium metabolism-associated LysR family transcriptional regulator [Paenibacillus sp. GD4]MDQ1914282.1 selenium metabolism-associated LysR family transcriptional regulator [Paenibacillus sp. GD4]